MRDVGIAMLTGAIVGGAVAWAEANRESDLQRRAEILENVRFVRQLSVEFPNQPKPLIGVDLEGTELQGLNLSRADLQLANLREADLLGTDLSHADLGLADLTGARVAHVNLTGVVGLDRASLVGASFVDVCWSASRPPQWPEGFDPPEGATWCR